MLLLPRNRRVIYDCSPRNIKSSVTARAFRSSQSRGSLKYLPFLSTEGKGHWCELKKTEIYEARMQEYIVAKI